jgi:hypothetical protein
MIQEAVVQFQGIIWQAAIFGICGTVFGGLVIFAFMYMFLERQKGILAVALVVGLALAACTGAYFVGKASAPVVKVPAPMVTSTPVPVPIPHPRVKKQAKAQLPPVRLCAQCQ